MSSHQINLTCLCFKIRPQGVVTCFVYNIKLCYCFNHPHAHTHSWKWVSKKVQFWNYYLFPTFSMFHFDFSCAILYLSLYCLILLSSVIGDYILHLPRNSATISYVIALSDTAVHGSIGAISWSMVIVLKLGTSSLSRYIHWTIVRDIVLCGLFSSMIDFDHVIAAKGFSIKVRISLWTIILTNNFLFSLFH